MAREIYSLASFNRGIVDRRGLARVDVKRIALAAETQKNWMPRVLGSMMLRPGTAYINNTASNAAARMLPFVFATDDTAVLELTNAAMRILINDTLLTRPSVTTAVTNGNFTVDISGWTDNDEVGATSSWVAPGYMQLVGDGTARAIRDQQVSVTGANIGVEHALRIVIARGPVYLRVGSSSGGDEYITETVLDTGTHSLSFTPTGDFYIRFFSPLLRVVWVDSCNVEAAGVVSLPTPWATANLSSVRIEQSADVVYVACAGMQQRKIERRGTRPNARGWSVVLYQSPDGPFKIQNITPTTLTASGLTGNINLTASKPLFRSTHVGALFSVSSVGQSVTLTSTTTGAVTDSIRVVGIGASRAFTVFLGGIAAGSEVDLQRSIDNGSTWVDVGAPYQWTANTATSVTDGFDNQIILYRLQLANRVAPDSVEMTLVYAAGSIRGIARVTGFTSSTVVAAEVLTAMGNTSATANWQEGQWSDAIGWPTAVRLHEGRLWWAGQNSVWGSVSDVLDSFDDTEGLDSSSINRTIGAGPVDGINWILAAQRIILGTDGAEQSIRSSSFDEPITPTNFHLKAPSTQGSANVDAVQIDTSGYFVSRSKARVYELSFDIKNYDYNSADATQLCPELGAVGIVRMAAQRQPDTRLHCVLSDGTVMLMVLDKAEEVRCWITVECGSGDIEDVCVLPALDGDSDDQVYYVVKRTINGATVRFIEKWAQETECRGGTISKLADAHVVFENVIATGTFTAAHLPNTQVVVWADGQDIGTNDTTDPVTWTQRYTTNGSGTITLQNSATATNLVMGIAYDARFKSAKLGTVGGAVPTPLNRHKRLVNIGIIASDIHKKGLRYGRDFTTLQDMPSNEGGTTVTQEVRSDYDGEPIEFPGSWSTDERLCLVANAPRPVTLLAATLDLLVN